MRIDDELASKSEMLRAARQNVDVSGLKATVQRCEKRSAMAKKTAAMLREMSDEVVVEMDE